MTRFPEAVTRLAREESGHVLALLAHRFGDLDLADEAVQDALTEALGWSAVPDNPSAWLYTVARNRAIDRLRRDAAARRRLLASAPEIVQAHQSDDHHDDAEEDHMIVDRSDVGDEQLRLMLLCCHPALDRAAQIALTLRLTGGLTTAEIAAAFLVPEGTLAQRIVRAKRKIRDAGIPLSIPENLGERVDALLTVLYLVFNEGYLSRSSDGLRVDLMDEAIRLTDAARMLLPGDAEVEGLLALELFTRARTSTRFDDAGELVLLDDQDRTRWDLDSIERANTVLGAAIGRMEPGPFQLQAVVASQHANARTASDTDWPSIVAVYDQLMRVTGSPVVALNRAVAVAMADGPRAGLALLDEIEGLEGYHLYWAARAELLKRAGEPSAAADALLRARAGAVNPAEQRHLDRLLRPPGSPSGSRP
jgi:RNA polymerase sigma-70 factor (ECF subfamily)